MPNNKHLTLDNRTTIETMLNLQSSFKEIAAALDKDPSTISKEIRSHLVSAMLVVCGFLIIPVPCVLNVKEAISVQSVIPTVNTLSAEDAPCAMVSAKISKKKSAPDF